MKPFYEYSHDPPGNQEAAERFNYVLGRFEHQQALINQLIEVTQNQSRLITWLEEEIDRLSEKVRTYDPQEIKDIDRHLMQLYDAIEAQKPREEEKKIILGRKIS